MGAVSYLFRCHRTTPVMRLDMDAVFWREQVQGQQEDVTRIAEQHLFEDLDFASHDQRCYGYLYPLKAGHDRASLTQAERLAFRKYIIQQAIRAGMNHTLFRDVAIATGHG
jgi:hypothetical protein